MVPGDNVCVWRLAAPILLILAAACGSGAGPSPVNYAGQWNGTTSQGTPISFVVSPGQMVTSITLGYSFDGCTGSKTFTTDTAIMGVTTAPSPVGSATFQSGPAGDANRALISFLFTSPLDAHGMVIFSDFDGCGADPASTSWTAARR